MSGTSSDELLARWTLMPGMLMDSTPFGTYILQLTADGEGIMEYANGDRYEGGWRNGQIYGYGTYYEKNGKRTSGYWINGVLQ